MNTLEKIKDQVAVEFGYGDHYQIECLEIEEGEKAVIKLAIMEIVTPRFARAVAIASLKEAAENAKVTLDNDPDRTFIVDKSSITNEKNIKLL